VSTRPIIALLTDFGTRDHYVGAMKGVALGICPEAAIVDITHEVAPQDILGGALELAAVVPAFPQHTIFVAVVDPGVGTARRALAARAAGHTFIGPDNGLLSLALDAALERSAPGLGAGAAHEAVAIENPQFARLPISRTFEGRDRFMPAAAWLAAGADFGALGPAVADWQRLRLPEPEVRGGAVTGEVLRTDRFGNLMTNIKAAHIAAIDRGGVFVEIERSTLPLVGTYADAGAGDLCALIGSAGYLEVAVNGGSAAESLGVGTGAPVHVRPVA
jgi:hypothetical protein